MATSAQLQARIDALEEAMARGVTSVSIDGKSVSYRSFDEMRKTLQWLYKNLGTPQHVNATSARFRRG